MGESLRARALGVGRPGAPRDHGRDDRAGLYQRVLSGGGGPSRGNVAARQPSGQLERPRCLVGQSPTGRGPARGLYGGCRTRGVRRRPGPAALDAGPAVLRRRCHPRRAAGMARGDGPPYTGPDRSPLRSRDASPPGCRGAVRGGGRAGRSGQLEAPRDRRDLPPRQRPVRGAHGRRRGPRPRCRPL